MNKKFVIIVALAGMGILIFSFGLKNFISKRSARLSERADLVAVESLLNLANSYESKRDYVKAKNALEELIVKFPDSEEVKKAEKNVEKLNMDILFSDIITDDSISYEIRPGDTLSGIASRFNTTVELIKKSNGLAGDLILPGKSLKVNKARFNIVVNKGTNILMLEKTGGEAVKIYPVSTGKDFSTPTGTFTIEEKLKRPVWYKVGAVVEPDSPEYELGARWMGLSLDGYGIHGTKDADSIGKHITRGCVRMKNEDVSELYAIVPSGTEVTIVE